MTVVVDASVALQWVVQEQDTEAALALWDRWQETAEWVIAPPLFRSEVTNALHQMVRRGYIGRVEAPDLLDSLLSAVATVEPAGLYNRALVMASDFGLTSTYDAVYLALAESEECEVWTADRRLYLSVRERLNYVRSVGEMN